MNVSPVFFKNSDAYNIGYRIIGNQGGTSSTKTYSILQLLDYIARYKKQRRLISIMGPTLPHIRKGSLRDYINILESDCNFKDEAFNKTNFTFQVNNSEIEFFSADQPGKVRGPRRDILFVNELNLIHKEVFEQALIRTNECCFVDFNPVSQFYYHTDIMTREDCITIKSTFRDNPFLSQSIIDEIYSRKNNTNWWRVYGEGEVGEVEGLVYRDWKMIDKIPEQATLLGYGMDFGYTNSFTALVAVYKYRGNLVIDELIYRKGLLSGEMIKMMSDLNKVKPIIADSEDPRLIDEIKKAGFNCRAVKKPKVYTRIEHVLNYNLHFTKNSLNLHKELSNYMWQEKDGQFLQEPVKAFDHGMDAMGYAIWELVGKSNLTMF